MKNKNNKNGFAFFEKQSRRIFKPYQLFTGSTKAVLLFIYICFEIPINLIIISCRKIMALITKRDTVLTTVPSVIPIKEADENSGAVLASVDGSYDVDIDETRIALRPFFFVAPILSQAYNLVKSALAI